MPRIFISYRREDSSAYAGRLFDWFEDRFGKDNVFMDIDSIAPGRDFVEVINSNVSSCDVLLAVIGKNWRSSRDDEGRRRLDNPEDFVRLEISAALKRDILVVPVLVAGAGVPHSQELPEELAGLVRKQAITLHDEGFRVRVDSLIKSIEQIAEGGRKAERERQDNEAAASGGTAAERKQIKREQAEAAVNATGECDFEQRREGDIVQRRNEAAARFQAGDLAGAIVLLRSLIREHPDRSELQADYTAATAALRRQEEEARAQAEQQRTAQARAEAARKAEEDRIARARAEAARKAEQARVDQQAGAKPPRASEKTLDDLFSGFFSPKTCPDCDGRGKVCYKQGFFSIAKTCPRCKGSGKILDIGRK